MNVVIKCHTAHIKLPRIHPSVTTSPGAFWTAQHRRAACGITLQKAPGEVVIVTDGWIRGRVICGAVWHLMTTFIHYTDLIGDPIKGTRGSSHRWMDTRELYIIVQCGTVLSVRAGTLNPYPSE
jgi:hypothetical protein